MSTADDTLGLYLHVPFCKHECPYCDFYKMEMRTRPASVRLDFPRRLALEWDLLREVDSTLARRRLDSVYLGGGTPSTLAPGGVAGLLRNLRETFERIDSGLEITLEANPENLVPARCEKWRAAGITRLSIGVQSFDERELELLERLHTPPVIPRAVRNARDAGITNLSLDLMFALPGQTMSTWQDNLRRAVDLAPDHLSFYGLTYHEGTPFESWRRAGRVAECDEDTQAEMYSWGADFLESQGFEHYEISNFARPGFRSRHNERYWLRRDVVGLGPGAHSNVGGDRWANPDDLDGWLASLALGGLPRRPVETLTPSLAAAERLYTGLRRREGLSRADNADLHARCLAWYSAQGPRAAEWMHATPDRVALTRGGWLVADAIVNGILGFS